MNMKYQVLDILELIAEYHISGPQKQTTIRKINKKNYGKI